MEGRSRRSAQSLPARMRCHPTPLQNGQGRNSNTPVCSHDVQAFQPTSRVAALNSPRQRRPLGLRPQRWLMVSILYVTAWQREQTPTGRSFFVNNIAPPVSVGPKLRTTPLGARSFGARGDRTIHYTPSRSAPPRPAAASATEAARLVHAQRLAVQVLAVEARDRGQRMLLSRHL